MKTATLQQTPVPTTPVDVCIDEGSPNAPASSDTSPRWTPRRLFSEYRGRILLTYGLFNLENLLRLSQPMVLGFAINGLLQSSYTGLFLFLAQHLAHLVIGSARRAYDTRVYTHIYTDLATRLVVTQRGQEVDTSRVSARSTLSRVLVDFLERDVPIVMRTCYLVVGALLMLLFYDVLLAPLCLVLLVPATVVNMIYSRRTFFFNNRLHDQLEQEVTTIKDGNADDVRDHYRQVGRWRIKLSDWEALNFGLMELFILGLMAATLVRACTMGGGAGDVFAVFRYVLMFVMGMDSVPLLVEKISRLRDIGKRLV